MNRNQLNTVQLNSSTQIRNAIIHFVPMQGQAILEPFEVYIIVLFYPVQGQAKSYPSKISTSVSIGMMPGKGSSDMALLPYSAECLIGTIPFEGSGQIFALEGGAIVISEWLPAKGVGELYQPKFACAYIDLMSIRGSGHTCVLSAFLESLMIGGNTRLHGTPVEGVKLYLIDPETNEIIAFTSSDSQGKYYFIGLVEDKEYHVVAEFKDTNEDTFQAYSFPFIKPTVSEV